MMLRRDEAAVDVARLTLVEIPAIRAINLQGTHPHNHPAVYYCLQPNLTSSPSQTLNDVAATYIEPPALLYHLRRRQGAPPDASMVFDPLSPTAPARVKVLVLPLGRIKRDRFTAFIERVTPENVVRLGDISPDRRPNRSEHPSSHC